MYKLSTFEFIEYRSGFMNGKEDLYFKIINDLDEELDLELDECNYWYILGYNCAIAYYKIKYNECKDILCFFDDEDYEKAITSGFVSAIVEYNKQTEEKAPIAQYIIRKK